MGVNERARPAEIDFRSKRRQAAALQEGCDGMLPGTKKFGEKFQALAKGRFVAGEDVVSNNGWNFAEFGGISWNFIERKTGFKAKLRTGRARNEPPIVHHAACSWSNRKFMAHFILNRHLKATKKEI